MYKRCVIYFVPKIHIELKIEIEENHNLDSQGLGNTSVGEN